MVQREHFKDVSVSLYKGILDLDGLMLSGLGEARAILKLHLHYNMNWRWTQAEIQKMQ